MINEGIIVGVLVEMIREMVYGYLLFDFVVQFFYNKIPVDKFDITTTLVEKFNNEVKNGIYPPFP